MCALRIIHWISKRFVCEPIFVLWPKGPEDDFVHGFDGASWIRKRFYKNRNSRKIFLVSTVWLIGLNRNPRPKIDSRTLDTSEFASNSTCMIFDIVFFLVIFFRVEFTVSRIVRSFVTAFCKASFSRVKSWVGSNRKNKRIRRRKRLVFATEANSPVCNLPASAISTINQIYPRARRRQRYHRIDTLSIQM